MLTCKIKTGNRKPGYFQDKIKKSHRLEMQKTEGGELSQKSSLEKQ